MAQIPIRSFVLTSIAASVIVAAGLAPGTAQGAKADAFAKAASDLHKEVDAAGRAATLWASREDVLLASDDDAPRAAARALAGLERELHILHSRRLSLGGRLAAIDKQLAAKGKPLSRARDGLAAIRAQSTSLKPATEAFFAVAQARIKLVSHLLTQLAYHRPTESTRASSSLDAMFEVLHQEYPHWKSDIDSIERRDRKTLVQLTTLPNVTLGPDDKATDETVEATLDRIERYYDLMGHLNEKYGKEVAHPFAAYVSSHAQALLADAALVMADGMFRTRSLWSRVDSMDEALSAVEMKLGDSD